MFFQVDMLNGASLVRGDDYAVLWRWSQGGTPVDMTGWTGLVNLYQAGDDLAVWNGPATLGSDGTIAWEIPATISVDLPKGELTHSTTLTDSLGKVRTRVRGRLRVL